MNPHCSSLSSCTLQWNHATAFPVLYVDFLSSTKLRMPIGRLQEILDAPWKLGFVPPISSFLAFYIIFPGWEQDAWSVSFYLVFMIDESRRVPLETGPSGSRPTVISFRVTVRMWTLCSTTIWDAQKDWEVVIPSCCLTFIELTVIPSLAGENVNFLRSVYNYVVSP